MESHGATLVAVAVAAAATATAVWLRRHRHELMVVCQTCWAGAKADEAVVGLTSVEAPPEAASAEEP